MIKKFKTIIIDIKKYIKTKDLMMIDLGIVKEIEITLIEEMILEIKDIPLEKIVWIDKEDIQIKIQDIKVKVKDIDIIVIDINKEMIDNMIIDQDITHIEIINKIIIKEG